MDVEEDERLDVLLQSDDNVSLHIRGNVGREGTPRDGFQYVKRESASEFCEKTY